MIITIETLSIMLLLTCFLVIPFVLLLERFEKPTWGRVFCFIGGIYGIPLYVLWAVGIFK